MIVLYGIPSEPPVRLVAKELVRRSAPFVMLSQRALGRLRLDLEVSDTGLDGRWRANRSAVHIRSIGAMYARPIDYRRLPEYENGDAATRDRFATADAALQSLLNNIPAVVLNRPRCMYSNGSKPYQAQLIREAGFSIPRTLITNDWSRVRAFRASVGRIVYKSISGIRSIVRELTVLPETDEPMLIPVQFQELVAGTDVRVHVVGRRTFCTAILHGGVDYRDREVSLRGLVACDCPAEVRKACRKLCRRLELPFAGVDLRIAPDGMVYCFEVNPSPGYSYYEEKSGQPISAAVADLLQRHA